MIAIIIKNSHRCEDSIDYNGRAYCRSNFSSIPMIRGIRWLSMFSRFRRHLLQLLKKHMPCWGSESRSDTHKDASRTLESGSVGIIVPVAWVPMQNYILKRGRLCNVRSLPTPTNSWCNYTMECSFHLSIRITKLKCHREKTIRFSYWKCSFSDFWMENRFTFYNV